ncbi:substrate-binding domain-containing protein [Olsenella urininfantis]|uniref:substrate-binding domain-containing protein n=1 Tax=Olsenella urininfantis TaxID=1871033 RepID=UPI000986946E|nr:BMP family ABC transporter substrate-binding protein [Olsenella urininfantis]
MQEKMSRRQFLAASGAGFLGLGLSACGAQTGAEKPAGADGDSKKRIVYVINGTLGDKSFFDSGDNGMKLISDKYGDKFVTDVREMTYDTSVWESTALDIASEGWDIMIMGTFDMVDYADKIATQYPDTKIWFFDEAWDFSAKPHDNVYGMLYAQNEGSYLVGMAAAYASKTGKVAFMGGMENKVLQDFFVGYKQGAMAVNPSIEVVADWTQSFSDSTVGHDHAKALYQQGNDVIFSCCSSCGLGAFDAAVEMGEGHYVIGVDGNQGEYWSSQGQADKAACTLTSMLKNVDASFLEAAGQELEGKLPYGKLETYGLDKDGVGFAVTDTTKKVLSEEQIAGIDKAREEIIAGTIKVDTAF